MKPTGSERHGGKMMRADRPIKVQIFTSVFPFSFPDDLQKKSFMKKSNKILRKLGVYGFDHLELLILASLVSEDPLLLVGKAGTGKTYLLNSISEALNLEHRHYNASFLSFDDLVGFPFPDSKGKTVSFLKTPATIWDAESVLIDEISRCKPEIQNKFFSIIHEKKLQGMALEKLKYRWAAMNPLQGVSAGADDFYEGSFSLDQALADRFAFIIYVPDWNELTKEEQELVIHPSGEGAITKISLELTRLISKLKVKFLKAIKNPSAEILLYCRIISSLLGEAGYRISPRRARLLARNFTSIFITAREFGCISEKKDLNILFKLGLKWSLPHRAWKENIEDHKIEAAHAECMRMVSKSDPKERWLTEFQITNSLTGKIEKLFEDSVEKEVKSLAVLQFMKQESMIRTAIFAFVMQPLINKYDLINEESLNELTKTAVKILKVDGNMNWRERIGQQGTKHPQWAECVHYVSSISEHEKLRKERAKQFFLYLITKNISIEDCEYIERELNSCFKYVKKVINRKNRN